MILMTGLTLTVWEDALEAAACVCVCVKMMGGDLLRH